VWAAPPAVLSDALVDSVLAELTVQLWSPEPYVLLFDLSLTGMPTPVQRQKLVSHMQDNAARIRANVLSLGVVQSSAVARGLMTALFWLAPPGVPHRLFETRDEAAAWGASVLASK
jgi:hypothetical protein